MYLLAKSQVHTQTTKGVFSTNITYVYTVYYINLIQKISLQ